MSDQIGVLGKYQIIREIARSNDIVYEAYDPVMNRRVALKELSIPSGSTPQQLEDRRNRFLREARAAGTLTHPNIVTIYEYGETDQRRFIAMEFLDGHTLRNEIDTKGFLPPDRTVDIAAQTLEALDYAHNHGVIHRDIKPDNVQLLPDGRVKITDFGIARLTFEPNLTMDGQVFGTPSYMSPEQVVGKDIDARSDLFSVGSLLYEMISGKKPFGGDSVVSITYAIMNANPPQPAQINWALWQVVERSLEKSPQLRYASADEMRHALLAALKASSDVVIDPGQGGAYAPQQFSNPTGQPILAPPPNNPYLSGPQQPSAPNPFGAPPNPYSHGSAPSWYGYNPMQQQGSVPPPMANQHPTAFPVPVPVYYPPPPRRPLLLPETRQFLGKALLALALLGSFFGLVIALVTGVSAAIQRDTRQRHDQVVIQNLNEARKLDVESAIAKFEDLRATLVDPLNKAAAARDLATLYERRGRNSLNARNFGPAEDDFKRSAELDPAAPEYASDLGELYGRVAASQTDPARAANSWIESSRQWSLAVQLETRNAERNLDYRQGAINALRQLANVQLSLGDPEQARLALDQAIALAPEGSPARGELQRQRDRI